MTEISIDDGVAAWERARSAEDLQVGWVSASQHLAAALDAPGPLDLRRFSARVCRLADEIGKREPLLVRIPSSRPLAFWAAMLIQAEVLYQRHERDRDGEVIEAFTRYPELVGELTPP